MDMFQNSTSAAGDNDSLYFSMETLESTISVARSTIFLITGACLSFIGTVGNVLFILCLWLETRLRSVSNYLITFFPLCPIISMYCQFLISIDRTVLVTHSVGTYKKWFNRKFATIYVLLGWMFHVIMIVSFITIRKPPELPGKHLCISIIALGSTRQVFNILNGCALTYCGTACICYGRLIYYVRQRQVALTSANQAYVKTSITLLKLCVIALTSTVLSPLLIYISFSARSNPRIFAALYEVGTSGFFLGFAINPFLYGYRIKMFRNKLKSIFMFCSMSRVAPAHAVTDNS